MQQIQQTVERFAASFTADFKATPYLVLSLGGTCVMVSLNSVGLVGLRELRRHSQLPIHAHRNGWGYLSRHPALGWDYAPWHTLWRLAGADHLHVNGLGNKFSESDAEVAAAAQAGCAMPRSEMLYQALRFLEQRPR